MLDTASMPTPVLRKTDFYRRWRAMEFGNRGHSWDTLDEVMASNLPGPFAIRYKVPGSRFMRYHIHKSELRSVAEQFIQDGANPSLFEFSPMQPDGKLVLQGEVQGDHYGLSLFFSRAKKPMRVALAESGKQVHGLQAKMILQGACDSSSLDDLLQLVERFPDHVIEFSVYSCHVGVIPKRNTVIWEVRKF